MARNILSGVLIISAAMLCVLAAYSAKRRSAPGVLWLTLLFAAMIIHTVGYLFELQAETLDKMLFCIRIEYVGASFYALLILMFARGYADERRIANRYVIASLATINALTLAFVWTNDYHGIFYSSVSVGGTTDFPVLVITKGIWYYLQIAADYVAITYSLIIVFIKLRRSSGAL